MTTTGPTNAQMNPLSTLNQQLHSHAYHVRKKLCIIIIIIILCFLSLVTVIHICVFLTLTVDVADNITRILVYAGCARVAD